MKQRGTKDNPSDHRAYAARRDATRTRLWRMEEPFTTYFPGHPVPFWIESDISPATIISVTTGKCESGAYMPAVTYGVALRTMEQHGGDVFAFLHRYMDPEDMGPTHGDTWMHYAVWCLSTAVELWCATTLNFMLDHLTPTEDATP